MADKAIPMSYLSKLKEQCDELYEKKGEGGTTVIANPTKTGTEDLTSLQVGETVYNVPATEIVFSTEAAADAVEVAGFSVEGQNFKFPSGQGGGATGYTVEFHEIYEGTVIYADGSTETISGNGTKNNVRMIVGLTGNQNSWGIQKAVCLYNGQVKYGLSATGDAQTVDIVIPVNNECFIESWPD